MFLLAGVSQVKSGHVMLSWLPASPLLYCIVGLDWIQCSHGVCPSVSVSFLISWLLDVLPPAETQAFQSKYAVLRLILHTLDSR